MGQAKSAFSKSELQEYEELTYLSKSDVLTAYNSYKKIDPVKIDKNLQPGHFMTARIPCEKIIAQTKELRLNPYGDRICHVFNTGGQEGMSFDDFLDMYSSFR